jgi:hypothetical protein
MRTSTLRPATTFVQIKYIFKYVYKRHDHATVEFSCQSDNATKGNVVEAYEIKKYFDY